MNGGGMYVPPVKKPDPPKDPPVMDWIICIKCRKVQYVDLNGEAECCGGTFVNAQEIFRQHAKLCGTEAPGVGAVKEHVAGFLKDLTDAMNKDMLETKEEHGHNPDDRPLPE